MDRVLTVPEAADYLKQSVYTIRNWIRFGKLRAKRVGRSYLITEYAIQELIQPSKQAHLTVKEGLTRMRELQTESLRAGFGPQVYKAVMADLDRREADAKSEMRSLFSGSGS
jgi:excisionase family DNA binding protein